MKLIQPLIWIALALAIAACSPNDPTALVASAKEYIAKREFNAAVIQLKNALQKEPEHAEARYLLGLASLESGDLASADIELNKALTLGVQTDELFVAVARTLLAKGDTQKLISDFSTKQLAAPARQAELLALVGVARLAAGQRDQARSAFKDALSKEPSNVTATLGLARLAAADQDIEGAQKLVGAALREAPSNYEAHLLKAELLAAQGKDDKATQAYRDAIAALPNHVHARLSLITHLVRLRSFEQANTEVKALEGIAPRDSRTSYAKALVLLQERKYPGAREAILEVLKGAPNHVPSLVIAGTAAFHTGAYSEAENHLRKAVGIAPAAVTARRMLAATRLRLGETDLAMKDVKQLLATAGEDASVVVLAGEASMAAGDIAEAARYYEKAKALQPQSPALQTRLAQIRFAAGDREQGIKELESASSSNPDAYQADLALIATYLRQRQADKALEAVKTLEKKQPDNPLTHNLRGLALMLKRDFAGARASYERAVKIRPTYMPAVANLARLDLREKKTAAARKRYEAVLQKEPNNEQAMLGLAVLLRMSGEKPAEIEKLLKRSVVSNPRSAGPRVALVKFYLRNRDVKAAVTAAQNADAALPNQPPIVESLAIAQLAAGNQRQAVASFTKLTELLPRSAPAQLLLARAQLAAKKPDEAIKALRAALVLQPDLESAQRDITSIYVSTGRVDQAVQEAKDLQAKHPDQPFGYALEAQIQVAQKNWGNAERLYRAALKKFDHPLLVMRSHAVMEAAGKHKEAEAMAQDWMQRHPKDVNVLSYLAERDIAARRFESAAKRYTMALEKQPDTPQFLNNLAWASHQLKQPKALEYAERAHDLASDNPAIMDTLGWILTQKGERERGLELLGRAAELAPDAHNIRLHFAKALIQAGRKKAAREELEMLTKLDSRLPVQKEAASLLAGL
jgi:putative PEP-CTERM system TPR-repeat lipoprotein